MEKKDNSGWISLLILGGIIFGPVAISSLTSSPNSTSSSSYSSYSTTPTKSVLGTNNTYTASTKASATTCSPLKTTCSQMSSCLDAYNYMLSCGQSQLDGDNDGVPCETLCGNSYAPTPTKSYTYVPPAKKTSSCNGASALCCDGSCSYSASRSGTCSHHGGVCEWNP